MVAPKAPAFTLRDLDGHRVSLKSFRGKTVVIDFWATWCAPCQVQIPVLNAFHREHRGDGVVVLGVSVDADGRKAVVPFVKTHEIDYRVLIGNETLAMRYGAPGYPSLVVVDPRGRIESLHVGVIDRRDLDAAVARAREAGRPAEQSPAAGSAQGA